jgi:ribosomal protein L37AE/L43A
MSKEKEYQVGICVECKVRNNDVAEKRLYQCKYCDRWFCEEHLEPRIAFIRDLETIIKSPAQRALFYEEWKREDGHPDFAFSRKRFEELDIEEKIRSRLIKEALDRLKEHPYRPEPEREPRKTFKKYDTPFREYEPPQKPVCPNCGSLRTMTTAFRKEFETFECLKCHHTWTEYREGEDLHEPLEQHQANNGEGFMKQPGARKPFPIKKAIGVLLVAVIIGAFVWYSPTIISTIQNFIEDYGYTRVAISVDSGTTIHLGDNAYIFEYWDSSFAKGLNSSATTSVFGIAPFMVWHPAIQGATYRDSGLEIKVSEVHSDYIVLLVKPL